MSKSQPEWLIRAGVPAKPAVAQVAAPLAPTIEPPRVLGGLDGAKAVALGACGAVGRMRQSRAPSVYPAQPTLAMLLDPVGHDARVAASRCTDKAPPLVSCSGVASSPPPRVADRLPLPRPGSTPNGGAHPHPLTEASHARRPISSPIGRIPLSEPFPLFPLEAEQAVSVLAGRHRAPGRSLPSPFSSAGLSAWPPRDTPPPTARGMPLTAVPEPRAASHDGHTHASAGGSGPGVAVGSGAGVGRGLGAGMGMEGPRPFTSPPIMAAFGILGGAGRTAQANQTAGSQAGGSQAGGGQAGGGQTGGGLSAPNAPSELAQRIIFGALEGSVSEREFVGGLLCVRV
ncbi:hypothetical protein T492DRAFT_842754 [Pavlovales sp. CCMP2436]|nr:hypothetical protein T492DRAFT_842754 [Pavlovales sp. CCMP2436]